MKIDRNNYEAYLIDYLDGNLSDDLLRKIEVFLDANPDLAEEFELSKTGQSVPDEIPSVDKESCYRTFSDLKNIPESKFEEFCVAYYEGDLDEEGRSLLRELVEKDAGKKKIFNLYGAIRFSHEMGTRYPFKSRLKKSLAFPLRRIIYISIAAAAALLIGLLLFVPEPLDTVPNHQAQNTNPIPQESPNTKADVSYFASSGELPVRNADLKPTETGILLAKADTNAHSLPGTIILASLAPISAKLENDLPVAIERSALYGRKSAAALNNASDAQRPAKGMIPRESQTVFINRETLFWNAVKASVKGFNSLTENDLALDTEQDNKGQITEIKIYAENFQFQHRFKRTIQN